MKNLFICIVFCLAFTQLKAQNEVLFKIKYLPGHNYKGVVSMDIKCNVTLSGDDKVIEGLKKQGIAQPIAFNMGMNMTGDINTGSTAASKIFPLTMNYRIGQLNASINGKDIPMPAKVTSTDVIIYGHVGADGKLKADSLNGGKLKDTSQKKIMQTMNSFQNMIKFPDHALHIGDTFTQDMPLNIPMAGNDMAANSKAVYKLVKIDDGKAYFDVVQSMNMSLPIKENAINLTGSGTGKLVYDIKNSFPVDYTTNITLKLDAKINTLIINGTAAMNMEYKYDIN